VPKGTKHQIAGTVKRINLNALHTIRILKKERKKAAETANPTATANATTGERPKRFCTNCKKDNHT
jgi:hypothetical protein